MPDAEADAAQRVHLLLGAHVIGAPQVIDDNDVARGDRGPECGCFGSDSVQSHFHSFLCL